MFLYLIKINFFILSFISLFLFVIILNSKSILKCVCESIMTRKDAHVGPTDDMS